MKELSFLLDTRSYGFIRNNFSFFLQQPQGQEVYHHYVELLEYEEQQSGLCALPKLTKVDIYPNAFQKMSVKLAVQVRYLMFRCYKDIKKLLLHLTHKEMCQEKFLISSSVNPQLQPWNSSEQEACKELYGSAATSEFTRRMNKLFDCLNSRRPKHVQYNEAEHVAVRTTLLASHIPLISC